MLSFSRPAAARFQTRFPAHAARVTEANTPTLGKLHPIDVGPSRVLLRQIVKAVFWVSHRAQGL